MPIMIHSKLFQQPTMIELPDGIDPGTGQTVYRAYQFTAVAPGVYGCEIEDEEHIGMLLAIPEGYKLSLGSGAARSLSLPPTTSTEPPALTEGQSPAPVAIGPDYDVMTEDEARVAFEAMMGRKAHHKTNLPKIIAALKAGPNAEPASTQED